VSTGVSAPAAKARPAAAGSSRPGSPKQASAREGAGGGATKRQRIEAPPAPAPKDKGGQQQQERQQSERERERERGPAKERERPAAALQSQDGSEKGACSLGLQGRLPGVAAVTPAQPSARVLWSRVAACLHAAPAFSLP
jgi:hypothetical protein